MPLNQGKHIIEVIGGKRCTLVETGITGERMEFLKKLLEFNGYEVMVEETVNESGGSTFKIGVTNFKFHPVIALYARKLKTPEGKIASPNYWNQQPEKENFQYWEYREKSLVSDEDLKIVPGVFMSV